MMCAVEQSLLCLEDTDAVDKVTWTDWAADSDDDDDDDVERACRRAMNCGTLLTDERVLANLQAAERHNRPSADCFCRQTEVLPYMRDTVVSWMLEVLEEQKCGEDVFYLSVNYLDRVLCALPLRPTQLQLVASVCMFLASKFSDTVALAAQRLVMYTDYSITVDQLLEWELLVVQLLHWDLSAVTPLDYVEQMLSRLSDVITDSGQRATVRRHALTFIAMCTADVSFMTCVPSILAASSISAAASGLLGHVWCRHANLLQRLHQLINVDIATLSSCQERIEQLLNNNVPETGSPSQSPVTAQAGGAAAAGPATPASKSTPSSRSQPSTPTDVRDVRV